MKGKKTQLAVGILHFFVWEQNIHDLVASHADERKEHVTKPLLLNDQMTSFGLRSATSYSQAKDLK